MLGIHVSVLESDDMDFRLETQDIVALIAVYCIIAAALCLSRYSESHGMTWDSRKITHIGVGAFIYVWWAFSQSWIMLAFFAIPFAIILFFAMIPGNPISSSSLGKLTNEMGHRYGLFLYVVSICIMVAVLFDHWVAATIAIVAMTRGDGFGSIIGRKYGKHKTINGKSLEGSLGVFLATFIFSLIIVALYGFLTSNGLIAAGRGTIFDPLFATGCCLLAALLASVTEALSPGELDNLFIPVIVSAALVLAGM